MDGESVYDFGLLLKNLRIKAGLNQTELAKRLQTSRANISSYENNVNTPPLDVIKSMSLFFRVSTDYLLGLDKQNRLLVDDLTDDQVKNLEFEAEQYRKLNTLKKKKS